MDDNLLSIENGTFSHTTTGPFVLNSIKLHVKYNTLTILTGPSGSGKTVLLEAILGELSAQ
jgi:ABC-type Mn2+/Zn2+ transport system ATPase subunit